MSGTTAISFFLLIACLLCGGSSASKAEKDLVDNLMSDYDPTIRPVEEFHDIVVVNFSLALQQIIDLDEKNQLLTTSIYMTWSWFDPQLTWDPSVHEGITHLRMPAKKVWKPDILVYNSAVDSFDQLLHTNVIVRYDGFTEWLPPGIFKTTCAVDIAYFPFDEQKCTIKFGAWTHHGHLIDLSVQNDGVADISAYYESGEWDLLSMRGERHSVKYDCCPDPFVDITYTIHIRRKTIFYGINLILPCVLVCSLTILIFLLPSDSGERITLGITVLLAMIVFLQLVSDSLPPTGTIPLLGKYFACSIIMVTLSVIASVFSLNFHYTSPSTDDGMPRWVELVFLQVLPRILFMKIPVDKITQDFIPTNDNKPEELPLMSVGKRLGNWQNESHNNTEQAPSPTVQQRHSARQIAKMCNDLHDIVARMKDEDEEEKISVKWKYAARVLDRFCLVFFIIFMILSTVLTIGMAP